MFPGAHFFIQAAQADVVRAAREKLMVAAAEQVGRRS
jgi:surfactin synthase thioesterase subunit